MASAKKRKLDNECCVFQEKFTDYFFVDGKGKPVCLVCGESLAEMKKTHLERSTLHYSSPETSYKN